MDKTIKLYRYVDGGINDTPFPNSENQIEISAFRYNATRMGAAPTITATIMFPSCLDKEWTRAGKVYAKFNNERFYLKQTPTSSYDNEDYRYKHSAEFVSERVILDNVYFYDAVKPGASQVDDKPVSNGTKFVFWGDIYEFADRLKASLAFSNLDYDVVVDTGVESEEKMVSFEDTFFSNAIQEAYNTYEVPYYFVGRTIHFGVSNNVLPTPLRYGVDNQLVSITKTNKNLKVVNRVTGRGSTENIPYYYPNSSPKGNIEAIASGNFRVRIVDQELFANNIALDGVITKTNSSYENAKVTFLGEEIYSGGTSSAQMSYGGTNKVFGISFTSNEVGVFLLSFSSSIVKYTLNGEEKTDADFGIRYYISVNDKTGRKNVYKSSGAISVIKDFEIPVPFANHEYSITIECYYAPEGKYYGKGGNIVFDARYSFGAKSGWVYKDKDIELKDIGLIVEGNVPSGGTITQKLKKYVNTSQNLMPSIYRKTDGAERFYNAVNGRYDGFSFINPFIEGQPREHIVNFEDIKPTIEGVKNDLGQQVDMFAEFAYDEPDSDETYEDTDDNSNVKYKHSYFFAKLRRLPFNLFDHAIENQPMTISFTSGSCGACKFKIGVTEEYPHRNPVQVNPDGTLKRDEQGRVICGVHGDAKEFQPSQQDTTLGEVWIALMKEEETYGIVMPKAPKYDENGKLLESGFRPETTDTFVITGIHLPEEYITAAEKRLEEKLLEYMADNNREKFSFAVKFSRIYFEENKKILDTLNENSQIDVVYDKDDNGDDIVYTQYVKSFSYSISEGEILPDITIELDENLTVGQNAIQNAISEVRSEIRSVEKSTQAAVMMQTQSYIQKKTDDTALGEINFEKGAKFGENGKLEVLDDKTAKLTIDYLEVTKKATFSSLEIQEKTHAGGQILLTPAAINCNMVEELDDVYRCYFQTKGEDGDEIFNQFAVGDQAICQTFNTWGSKYYWRLVVGTGEDYIDLSKADCDKESNAPEAGDKIIQLGNREDESRQNAIVIAAHGDGSPYIIQYKGINNFELPEDKIVTKLSAKENILTGKVHMEMGSDGLDNLPEWIQVRDTANEALEKVDAIGESSFEELRGYVDAIAKDLQGQIDGAIDSYFYEYEPSLDSAPAVDWDTAEEKESHLNDTFTNLTDGRSWRWSKDSSNNYAWVEITDTATSEALRLAGKAQETADGKMTVFMSKPTPPYKAGDLWAGGENQPLKRCVNSRENGAFASSDWALADNAQQYADAIKEEITNSVNNTVADLNQAIADVEAAAKDYTDEGKKALEETITILEKTKANINDVYDKAAVDGKVTRAEQEAIERAEALADSARELAELNIKAWADGEIDEAEARAIAEAQAKVDAAKKEMEEYANQLVNGMNLGGENLLRNSGFTGDYLSEQLADQKVLEGTSELYSAPFDHWTKGSNIVRVSLPNNAASGYGVQFPMDTDTTTFVAEVLGQELYYPVLNGDQYVFSFKAKSSKSSTTVSYTIGGITNNIAISEQWTRHIVRITPNTTTTKFELKAKNATICELQLERGKIATTWKTSPFDNASERAYYQSLKYLQNALDGATQFYGGLVLTEQIRIGDYDKEKKEWVEINGGMSGIYESDHDIAFWAGGTDEQAIETVMRYSDNPTYQPSQEELSSLANYVVTHGGRAILNDAIVRGTVYARNGVFGGRLQLNFQQMTGYNTLTPNDSSSIWLQGVQGEAYLELPEDDSFDGWMLNIVCNPRMSKSDGGAAVTGKILCPNKLVFDTWGIYIAEEIMLPYGGTMQLTYNKFSYGWVLLNVNAKEVLYTEWK